MGALSGNDSWRKDLISVYLLNFPGLWSLPVITLPLFHLGLFWPTLAKGSLSPTKVTWVGSCALACVWLLIQENTWCETDLYKGFPWACTGGLKPRLLLQDCDMGVPLCIYEMFEHESLWCLKNPPVCACSSVLTQITCASILVKIFRT